jgi:hypothetical protein
MTSCASTLAMAKLLARFLILSESPQGYFVMPNGVNSPDRV